MQQPYCMRRFPHTPGTARQTRTSLKPYCCSTHLNVFKFQIVSVQRFALLKFLFHPLTHQLIDSFSSSCPDTPD
jgi:hypothetical protein